MNSILIKPINEEDFRLYLTKLNTLPSDKIDYDEVNNTALGFFLFKPDRMELEQELNDILDKHRGHHKDAITFYHARDSIKTKIRDVRTELTELNAYTANAHYEEYKQFIDDTLNWFGKYSNVIGMHYMLPILTHYITTFRHKLDAYVN